MTKEYIDMTPTWSEIVPVLLMALENGNDTGRAIARAEIRRMATLADERNVFAQRLAELEAVK